MVWSNTLSNVFIFWWTILEGCVAQEPNSLETWNISVEFGLVGDSHCWRCGGELKNKDHQGHEVWLFIYTYWWLLTGFSSCSDVGLILRDWKYWFNPLSCFERGASHQCVHTSTGLEVELSRTSEKPRLPTLAYQCAVHPSISSSLSLLTPTARPASAVIYVMMYSPPPNW